MQCTCFKQRKQNAGGGGDAPDTANSSDRIPDNHAMEGWYEDLGIIEPDDNPLSCLVDEEDEAGNGRPKMCFFVAPVDPRLAVSRSQVEQVEMQPTAAGCYASTLGKCTANLHRNLPRAPRRTFL